MLCLYTETRLLRGHQHLPPLPALQLDRVHPPCNLPSHPRETPSRARTSEDPTQPHPTLLFVGHFVGLLIHPPHCGRASQPLSAPPGCRPRELRARLSGWGLGSELWELGQGLLGQRQSGCRLLELHLLSFLPWGVLYGPWMSQLSRDMLVRREGH